MNFIYRLEERLCDWCWNAAYGLKVASDWFEQWTYRHVVIGFLAGALFVSTLLIFGCATFTDPIHYPSDPNYWIKDRDARAVAAVIEKPDTTMYCTGQEAVQGFINYGCFFTDFGLIYIRSDMSPERKACVLSHELKHAQGWSHPKFASAPYIDCGDGTRMN